MKTRLTCEQSQHLIDLGVPKNLASDIEEYSDPISQWTHRGAPIFKLEDFLNGEILPKEIKIDNSLFNLEIYLYNDIVCVIYCVGGMFPLAIKKSKELIDALYQLACWYYGEYLKK